MAQAAARDEGGGPGAGSAKSAAADAEDAARGRVFAQHGPGGGGCDGREFWRRPNEADGGHSEIREYIALLLLAFLFVRPTPLGGGGRVEEKIDVAQLFAVSLFFGT
jgi:hypothetical protein